MRFDYEKKTDIFTAVPELMLPCECYTSWVFTCALLVILLSKPAGNDFQTQALHHMKYCTCIFYLYILLLRSNEIKGHSS